MSRKRAQPDQRADTCGGAWVGIPHVVLDSAAYRDLGLMARAVLVELVRRFNGYNNGDIAASFDQLSECLSNTNRRAISAAIVELFEHGMVEIVAGADRLHHKARRYRLTFVTTGRPGATFRPATNDYRNWKAPARSEPVRSGKPAPIIR